MRLKRSSLNITQGEEIMKRYAQWIANADLDRNGETTLDELRASRASDLLPSDKYNLSSARHDRDRV